MGGAFCVASCVHVHHSVWVTDAWRVLQAICQGEIYTNMTDLLRIQCAFVHAVGGVNEFALPYMCLYYSLVEQRCSRPP